MKEDNPVRNQFTFYRSFIDAIRKLPRKEQGAIVLAISYYALDGEQPSGLSPIAETVFTLVKPTLDSANKKSTNQSHGTHKRVTNDLQTVHKKEVEKEVEVEGEKEGEIEIENECYISPLPPAGESKHKNDVFVDFAAGDARLLSALRDFEQMRIRIKKPMTERAKELLIAKLNTFPIGDWVPILDQSVMSCWQGIFPLGGDKGRADAGTTNPFAKLLESGAFDE